MKTTQIKKRHSIAWDMPIPEACADERPDKASLFFDGDNFVAMYVPGAADDLTDLAWKVGDKAVSGVTPDEKPPELDPWIKRAQELAPDLKEFRAGLITTNAPTTPAHTDSWTQQGEVPGRSTVMFGYTKGDFTGGEYVLAEYGLAFDVRDGDMLISGTQIIHGNMPRDPEEGDYQRRIVIFCLNGQPNVAE